MAGTTAGALSNTKATSTEIDNTSAVATGGTTPYTYQWYRSTTSGFTPGSGTSLSGKTALTLVDTGLTPGTQYYYKVVAIDSAATPTSSTATQLAVATLAQTQSQNQFQQTGQLGTTDLHLNFNTMAVKFDPSKSGTLYPGSVVKWTATAGGVPMVEPCTAEADIYCGVVNFNMKDRSYAPGDMLEISRPGNVIRMMATAAASRGDKLASLPPAVAGGTVGGVVSVTGGSNPVIGEALDTVASGALVRVQLWWTGQTA